MKTIASLALCGTVLLLSSCATTPEGQARQIRALAYSASSIGTSIALDAHPEYRPAFQIAHDSLAVAVDRGEISGEVLRDILAKLPVKELASRTARLAIEGGTMLFDTITGKPVDLNSAPLVLAAATGIRDGLAVALAP